MQIPPIKLKAWHASLFYSLAFFISLILDGDPTVRLILCNPLMEQIRQKANESHPEVKPSLVALSGIGDYLSGSIRHLDPTVGDYPIDFSDGDWV